MSAREPGFHEYRCTVCGVRFKGAERTDGRVVAGNGPPRGGAIRDCVCMRCAESSSEVVR